MNLTWIAAATINGFITAANILYTVAGTPTYHGHSHQKAIKKGHYAVDVLHHVNYKVNPLDSGWWEMVESSGHEAEHHRTRKAIARISYE